MSNKTSLNFNIIKQEENFDRKFRPSNLLNLESRRAVELYLERFVDEKVYRSNKNQILEDTCQEISNLFANTLEKIKILFKNETETFTYKIKSALSLKGNEKQIRLICDLFLKQFNIRATFEQLIRYGDNTIFNKIQKAMRDSEDLKSYDIHCEWEFNNPYIYSNKKIQIETVTDFSSKILHNDWKKALKGEKTDLVLKFSNGESIKVHKTLLCLRSDYFNILMDFEDKKGDLPELKIESWEKKHFMYLLEYLYTGKIEDECKSKYDELTKLVDFMTLMVLSDEYQIKELTKLCENIVDPLLARNSLEKVEDFNQIFSFGLSFEKEMFIKKCLYAANNKKSLLKDFISNNQKKYPVIVNCCLKYGYTDLCSAITEHYLAIQTQQEQENFKSIITRK